jgi:protein-disulfide isomerase
VRVAESTFTPGEWKMSRGSAWVSILFAFFVGLVVGKAVDGPGGGDAEVAAAAEGGVAAPAEVGGPERFNIPVTAAQPSKGANDALVTIVEFSDFQCPYCGRAHPELSRTVAQGEGKVKLVFKHYPLSGHSRALPAALAAEAAGRQGKFWEMADLLFENQSALEDGDLLGYAQQLGLDPERFKADMASDEVRARIEADRAEGAKLGVSATPTLFIGGRKFKESPQNLGDYVREELER